MTAFLAFLRIFPARVKIAFAVALVLIVMFVAYKYQQARAERAEAQLRPARVTIEALDTVNTETAVIQAETMEKQRAVDEIQGSDTRLPDGYGARIECVRRGGRNCNPR